MGICSVLLPAPERGAAAGVCARLAAPGLGSGGVQTLDPILDIRDLRSIFRGMPADPMLVGRRHVDLQRVRSAICCDAR
ncbi:putative leader peptide [Nonomuraea sp. NPDC051191]|uniref:putative leader peptide n=1 Tax=Nonomuraea sp. NPDC051191 TaxID=3364372 RepID=UPI0037A3AD31